MKTRGEYDDLYDLHRKTKIQEAQKVALTYTKPELLLFLKYLIEELNQPETAISFMEYYICENHNKVKTV